MKTFKKIASVVLVIIVLSALGGYLYFQKKFTPPDNYLTVSHLAQNVPIKWNTADENPYAALYLPVTIKGIDTQFYMQLDFGSPITLFYTNSIKSIQKKFQGQIKPDEGQGQISLDFSIGNMNITSNKFSLLDYGQAIDFDKPEALNVIGTIGTDLLEKRVTILDFKNSTCSFVNDIQHDGFTDFEFKKRKIMITALIENEKLKLLYDSGSSAYELITNKEEWQKYRIPSGKLKTEKGNSWGNALKVISAPANRKIKIGNVDMPLSEVTYVEGTSKMQNFLMKRSGMQGMIGNKLFLNHKLILDCRNEKFKVE